jgi:hypothetical protein
MPPVAARSLPAHFKQRYVVPALLLLMHACDCSGNRPEPPPAPVTSLQVLPSTVYVIPGAVFVMRARMLDALGGAWPSDPLLAWTPGSDLTIIDHGADSVVLTASNIGPTSSVSTGLQAQLGSLSAAARITILATNASGSSDSAKGTSRVGMSPDVMLLDAPTTPKTIDDSLIAFVGIGLLGDISGGPGEAARLATDQAFYVETVDWHAGNDVVDMQGGDALQSPTNPTFTIWIATSDASAPGYADADAKWATRVFRREYTGVLLNPVQKLATGFGDFILDRGANLECIGLVPKLQALNLPVTTAFKKESLNVVYVDEIRLPPKAPDFVATSSMLAGYTCPLDQTAGTVILISASGRSSGALTHELGHALGLHEPNSGHTDLLNGFSYTDMMQSWESDLTQAPRSTFSLGQVFRIGIDDQSWLRFLTGKTRDCDPTEVDRSCPPLAKDFQ